MLLSQESPKSTWLCNLASVFFYVLQNISRSREQKAKYKLSSQTAEVSLGLNIIGVSRVFKIWFRNLEINIVLVKEYSTGFMSWYMCCEWRKVQAISPAHRGLNYLEHWIRFINRRRIGPLDKRPFHPRRLDVASEYELIVCTSEGRHWGEDSHSSGIIPRVFTVMNPKERLTSRICISDTICLVLKTVQIPKYF